MLTFKKFLVASFFTVVWLIFGIFLYFFSFFGGKKEDRSDAILITKSAIKAMWSWE